MWGPIPRAGSKKYTRARLRLEQRGPRRRGPPNAPADRLAVSIWRLVRDSLHGDGRWMSARDLRYEGRPMEYCIDLFTGTTWEEFRRAGAKVSGFRERTRASARRVKPG